MKHYLIDSYEVIKTNHQQYYISIRSNRPEGSVILCLHGGPGLPDAELVRNYNSEIADTATLVMWDQRGAGEAYSASFAFKKNLMKERVLEDIDNLVTYLCQRFQTEKVTLLAHEFGTVLSVWYAHLHPDKVDCLIQINPIMDSGEISSSYSLKTLLPVVPNILVNRHLIGIGKLLTGANWSGNTPLAKEQFDFRETVHNLSVPLYVIAGASDTSSKDWFEHVQAPEKAYYPFENCNGNPMFEASKQFNQTIKEIMGRR